MSEEKTNLKIIKNPNSKHFLQEIKSAHLFLTDEQIPEFFEIVLNHFSDDVSLESKKAILLSICRILSIKKNLDVFVNMEFPSLLPFLKKKLTDDLFNVLYILALQAPHAFNEDLCAIFRKEIPYRGAKSLLLITIFAQKFNDLEDPWSMLDLLFHEKNRFSQPDIADKYSSLLSSLVQSYPEFKRGRGADSWNVCCDLLKIEDPIVVKSVLNSMCGIASNVRNCKLPAEDVKNIIKTESLISPLLNCLLLVSLDTNEFRDPALIKMLVKIAGKNTKSTLVLMKLAQSREIAQILVSDPIWMEKSLPKLIETLRLFLVVFQHTQLRHDIAYTPEFITLMSNLVAEKNSSLLSIVVTIVRRLDLTPEFIQELSDSSFLVDFFDMTRYLEDPISWHSAILLIDKIVDISYVKEFPQMCESLLYLVKSKSEVAVDSLYVLMKLAKHSKCNRKLSELRALDVAKKLQQDPQYSKISTKFIKIMEKYQT